MNQDNQSSREILLHAIGDASRDNQSANDLFDERMGVFLGVNRSDSRCLDIIERASRNGTGRVSAGHLANESGLTTGAVTAVIDRLEAVGYVNRVRDPADRRKVWIEGTEALGSIVEQIYGFYDTVGPMLTERFDVTELRAILAFLQMGTIINREFAAGVGENATGVAPNTEARVERAATIRRAMEASAEKLRNALDKVGR